MSKFAAGIRGAWQATTGADKGKWTGLAGDYTAAKDQIVNLKRWLGVGADPLEAKVTAIEDKVAKGHHTDACKLLGELKTSVASAVQLQTDGKADFENQYNPLKPKIDKVLAMDGGSPAPLKLAQTGVRDLNKGITDEVALGGYLAATALLPAFVLALNPAHTSAVNQERWKGLAGDYTAAKKQIVNLKRWLGTGADPLEAKVVAIDDKVTKGAHDEACTLLGELKTEVATATKPQTDEKADFEIKYNLLKVKIDKIEALDAKIPKVLKAAQTAVKDKHKAITDEVAQGGYLAAKTLLPTFESVVNPTHVSAVALLKARKDVRSGLKPIAKRLKTARNLATANDPGLTTQIGTFNTAFKAFHDEEKVHKYVQAKPLLPALLNAVKELVKAHAPALVNAADTPDKARLATELLDDEELKALTSTQHVGLLAKLREGKTKVEFNNDPALVNARCKVYRTMSMNKEFVKKDKAKRTAIVNALKNDPVVEDAFKNWDTLRTDEVKVRAFVTHVLTKQLDTLKPPDLALPTLVFSNDPGDSSGVDCGGFTGPPVPGTLEINMHPNADFDDFREVLDTMLHENTHNYQAHLVAMHLGQSTSGTPSTVLALPTSITGDPDLMDQIKMFAENEAGYVPPEQSEGVNKKTYEKQPYEEHAWLSGKRMSKDIVNHLKTPPTVTPPTTPVTTPTTGGGGTGGGGTGGTGGTGGGTTPPTTPPTTPTTGGGTSGTGS